MDEILKSLDELEAAVENSRGGFMGKRLINEEEFFTRTQKLRSQVNALGAGSNRDILEMAMSLPRDERRKLAEWLYGFCEISADGWATLFPARVAAVFVPPEFSKSR